MRPLIPSAHILGSPQFGGADQFYLRLVGALHDAGQPVVAIDRARSPVARALVGSGIEQVQLPFANRWDYWTRWRIGQELKRRRPAVVQTYMGRATRLTHLPKSSRMVHVARLGGFYKIDGYYRHAHAWVGNTRSICDYLVREGLPADRVFHIGNFVPEARTFSAESQQAHLRAQGVPEGAWRLFSLGRLVEKKGFQDLLSALAELPPEIAGRPWRMLIAGDGENRDVLVRQVLALGLEERVVWLGWQDPPDPWYALADLVVVPSRHEPLGNVILEAWSYRRPVVSTASDGAQELIQDGSNGLIVPVADPAALAGRIRAILEAADGARSALGEAGHRELQGKYGRQAIVDAYLDLYARLLGEQGGGA
jgi:glycosyltransferase involved in cell wall biosynthesis